MLGRAEKGWSGGARSGDGCGGWGKGTKGRGGEKLAGPGGASILYNKNRSSDLSRTGLWVPRESPLAAHNEEGAGGRETAGTGGDHGGFSFGRWWSLVRGWDGPLSQLLRDFECWISHCRVMSMLSFSLQEIE